MKFSLAFLVALALSGAVNVHANPLRNSNELHGVFEEFLALVPQEKVVEIFLDYLENDAEVQAAVAYVQSDSFKELVTKVENIEDVINFYEYLQESGLDIYNLVNKIHEVIGLPPLVPGGYTRNVRITGGVAGLIADIKAILPMDAIKALYEEKLQTSPAFAKLVERLRSPRFQQLINALRSNEEFQKIVAFAKEAGVDVDHIKDLLSSLLGLEFPNRQTRATQNLNDDLQDFLNILPTDKIIAIALDYLENDPEVAGAIEYLESDEFQRIVQEVEDMQEARDVLAYLEDSGLNAYEFLNKIHDFLGLPPFKPTHLARQSLTKAHGGLAGLIADIKAILPIADIKALYYKKLESSQAFTNFIERLSSQKFQDFVDAVLAKEEARVIINKLKAHGVDLQAIADLLHSILGLQFPKPAVFLAARNNLQDDLNDFLALLPMSDITELALEYLDNDPQVQEAIEYMESDAFHKIVQDVEAMQEAKEVLAFLQESGLDAYGFLNMIHEFLGIPEFKPSYLAKRSLTRVTGGISGLIADIKAMLPLDDIKALYYQKLENSLAFSNLIKRLSSREFQEFVDAVLAKEEARVIITKLKAHGVDLQAIADLLQTILGLHFPKPAVFFAARNNLQDDLNDFLALLPMGDITELAFEYLDNDAQVQEAIEYMESDAFHKIVQDVEAMQEAKEVLAFLQESGLDAYGFLNMIHEFLGIPEFKPSYLANRSLTRVTGGISGLIADIKAMLPLDDIKTLYYQKLENSLAFSNLIKRLSSREFQEFVDAVLAKEEARVIITKLKAHGVDLQAIADLLQTILGLHFPKPAVFFAARNNLQDDLNDFLALLPMGDITELAFEYLDNDAQVQEAIEYMESDAFHKIVQDVEAMQEAKEVLAFLQESGLDAYGFLNMIHEFLGIPEFKPSYLAKKSLTRVTGGISGLIADIKAMLPLDDIKALYYRKLENSLAFSNLIKRLSSREFQEFVDAVLAKEEARVIITKLKAHGVDLQAIADLLQTILGLHFPKPAVFFAARNNLQDDLNDFLALLPMGDITELAFEYLDNDAQVQEAIEYMESDAFHKIVQDVEAMQEAKEVLAFLQESGLDAYGFLNMIHEFLGIPEFKPSYLANRSLTRVTGGISGLIADIKAMLPLDDIKTLYYQKLENSLAFSNLIKRLSSREFQEFVDAVLAKEEARVIITKLKAHGVDLQAIADLLQTILGLHFPKPAVFFAARNNLQDDLNDFLALLPMGDITELAFEYLDNDAQVQEAIEYMESDAFHKIVQDVEAMQEAKEVLVFLQESGLDAYGFLNMIHEFLGIPEFKPSYLAKKSSTRVTGGISGLIADIKAMLPLDDIKALYYQKLENSLAFSNLIKRLSSREFQEFVDAVLAKEEARVIITKLKAHGVDLQAIADLLQTILGLHFPKPAVFFAARNNLQDDLNDFLALLPMSDITELALEYLDTDAQVQEAIEYMESDAFHKIVQDVEAMQEAKEVLAFLQESGLDAYGFLNMIHEFLGIPEFKPSYLANRSLTRVTGGISGLIADIKAMLPLDDIKALYYQKLENSLAFSNLIKRLSSREFQEFVDAVLAKEEARVIITKLKAHGVDLQAIADLLQTILGLHFPKPAVFFAARNNLQDDLNDFLALLPMSDITELALEYLDNDAQVQEAIEYMESDAFHKIVQDVEAMQEAKEVLAFLQESGLDAYGFLNMIHEFLGIPEFKPSYLAKKSSTRVTGGISGLIADIKAMLPLDDIKALYYQKLENSLAFSNLIKRLSSREFQEFVDAVLAKEEARVIITKLKAHGVDLQAIADLLQTILGLHFPKPAVFFAARNNLQDDLNDFLALLPMSDITELALEYLDNDAQVQEAIEYMESDAFHKIVQDVEAMQEAKEVLAFLQESGLDAYGFLNMIHEFLGIPEFKPSYLAKRSLTRVTGGISGLIADIKAMLPLDDIKALYYQKLENSLAFSNLIKRLSSQEFQDFVDSVLAKDEARVIINKLKEHNVDLNAIADLLTQILGLHFPKPAMLRASDELSQDLQDFMNLVPLEKVVDIAVDYIFNDAEVQKAMVYVKSKEFRKLATAAEQNKEFRAVLGYLDESGLAATTFMNNVNDYLNIPQVQPSALRRSMKSGGGVRGMLDAIEAVLPRKEIEALFEYKKKNSKAFSYLIERLEASEFQVLINELVENEDFRKLGYEAASYGIDLEVIVDFMKRVFGIEMEGQFYLLAARSLEDDLKDFVALLPVQKIRRIVIQYFFSDEEVKAAVAYVRSTEFAQLVKDLNDIPEYHDLLHSLEKTGLDVYAYIEKIHKLIGYSPKFHGAHARSSGGIAGMIQEIKATLPVDDIKALYESKLQTSEEFAGLVELISSDKFQAVTDALFANKIFQDILHRLQSHGINLQVVADFFLKIFGITTPPGIIDFRFRW